MIPLVQHLLNDREFFGLLPREEMGIPQCHGDGLMSHELLQFHQRNFAGLCKPGCEGMAHGMQSYSIQGISILWGHFEIFNSSPETSWRLGISCTFAGTSEKLLPCLE